MPDTTLAHTDENAPSGSVRIPLPERFTFQGHRDFRLAYHNGQPPAPLYIVDFSATRFIDSAGLGMLLQLSEHVSGDSKRIRMTNCNPEIRATLSLAGIDRTATIG